MDVCQCDWIVDKIRNNDTYAQNFYAALCNQEWREDDVWEVLRDKTWSCSWRSAGGIVADIQGKGDYMDWYCSGMMQSHPDDNIMGGADSIKNYVPEGTVTDEIRWDLAQIGWHPVVDQ
jgi:hypothetical protein